MNGAVSKTVVGLSVHRGFESLPLRLKGGIWVLSGVCAREVPVRGPAGKTAGDRSGPLAGGAHWRIGWRIADPRPPPREP